MNDEPAPQSTREFLIAIYLTVLGIAVGGGAALFDAEIGIGIAALLVVFGLIDAAIAFYKS